MVDFGICETSAQVAANALSMMNSMNITAIGTIETPFREKFAIPRQAQIVQEALGTVQFAANFRHADSLNGLAAHSHYWLVWGFHANADKEKTLTVRPPRLGGNAKVGVFSTRSPFRPNNLGLSVVKLEAINTADYSLTFSGVDMLSGSPIYDIKPYIPYADSRLDAVSAWAEQAPKATFAVQIPTWAKQQLQAYERQTGRRLLSLITALLAYDARPAYKKNRIDDKIYATQLYDVDVAWQITDNTVTIVAVTSKQQKL